MKSGLLTAIPKPSEPRHYWTGRFWDWLYLENVCAPKGTLYNLIDVGDVEGDARKLKQFVTERVNALEPKSAALPGTSAPTNSAALLELKRWLDRDLVNGTLAATISSKFFGPEQYVSYFLSLWIVFFVAHRWRRLAASNRLLQGQALRLGSEQLLPPEEADESLILPPVQRSDLGWVLKRALDRFAASRDIAATEAVVRAECDGVAQAMDTSLAMVRYVIWAVPSIGFLGTVRGMGQALAKADSPENLPDVVGYLAVAFDTTLVGLLLCLALMLLSQQFQRYYEHYSQRLGEKCEKDLIRRLYVPTTNEAVTSRQTMRNT